MDRTSWWLWLAALVLAAARAARDCRSARPCARAWAWWGLVALYPLGAAGLLRGVAWVYAAAPEAVAARLMPSRGILPLAHYQARAQEGLRWATAALLALALLLAAMPLARQVVHGRRWRAWRDHAVFRLGARLGLLVTLAFIGYNALLHLQFTRPHPVFYTGCRKVWGHRGHPEPPAIAENTIASYRRAFDLGAAGVEMDVRYDPERREYFIGRYDRGAAPPPGQRLLLEDVFAAVGARGYFWLDIKTIGYLTPDQAQRAADDLAVLLQRYGLRERAIVESDAPDRLQFFARAGLHTSYWIFNVDEEAFPNTPWDLWWALVQVKRNYIRGGFSAISMDRRFYTPMVAWMLRGARIHLFTVNHLPDLRQLVANEQVRVILTDTAHYDLTACP